MREERQAALSKWSALVRLAASLFAEQVAQQVLDPQVSKELGNLEVLFCKKSTNTLLNRSYSLKKFVLWCVHRFPLEPLGEPLLFLYLQELQAIQAAASTADQLVSTLALAFVHGTLGLRVHIDSLRSHRVTGLAHLQLKNKHPVKQALPLTARQVLFLEAKAAAPRVRVLGRWWPLFCTFQPWLPQ